LRASLHTDRPAPTDRSTHGAAAVPCFPTAPYRVDDERPNKRPRAWNDATVCDFGSDGTHAVSDGGGVVRAALDGSVVRGRWAMAVRRWNKAPIPGDGLFRVVDRAVCHEMEARGGNRDDDDAMGTKD